MAGRAYAAPVLESTTALRYITPLREGGSPPGLIEAEDLGTYVVKFRSAGQGPKVLVAEVVVGELARRLRVRRALLSRRPGRRRGDLVARRVRGEHRSQLAQPQPAGLARAAVGHRPRRSPVLPFRDGWTDPERFAVQPYDASDHVLHAYAGGTALADAELAPRVTAALLTEVLALVPDSWLAPDTVYPTVAAIRAAYVDHLRARVARRTRWLSGAAA